MSTFQNAEGKSILLGMVKAIQENKKYLGDIDGLIGDGDHGMNMNKGFTLFGQRIADRDISFAEGLDELSTVLMTEIGGSMGPIYGTIFAGMAERGRDLTEISLRDFSGMVEEGLSGLREIVQAQVGDKTLVDTLGPAGDSLKKSAQEGEEFKAALEKMKTAAEDGMNSTKNLVARFGRSSRLGERSRGVLDAGAVSCCILLKAMADGIEALL
ncbi:dihydroxyacetone kinase subunit L [Caproiciproducens sp. NJN-50]|uniref:dihydroxyacetone kinase subunit DhaL n=1 Tax=Caproiciproducens sp. NJN-50 TaxID=2507162 RepID=UPI000FFE027A|nr:dihydroxyacetone kinase subunit DhaL [Caproiciproducens sp. NJN-50]QAT48988.1 dihydroxyacetone kinase subunit L [Caproiciproducens sp. NJN-50]